MCWQKSLFPFTENSVKRNLEDWDASLQLEVTTSSVRYTQVTIWDRLSGLRWSCSTIGKGGVRWDSILAGSPVLHPFGPDEGCTRWESGSMVSATGVNGTRQQHFGANRTRLSVATLLHAFISRHNICIVIKDRESELNEVKWKGDGAS